MSGEDDPRNWGSTQPERDASGVPIVVVPDDLSELDDEIAAYRREQRAARRRERRRLRYDNAPRAVRWLLPRGRERSIGFSGRDQRRMLPLAITGTALLLSIVVTVLLTMLAPRTTVDNRPAKPLAKVAADGKIGDLMPSIALASSVNPQANVQDMRPAVIVSLPNGCGCADAVANIKQAANAQNVTTYAITHDPVRAQPPPEALKYLANYAYNDISGTVDNLTGKGQLAAIVVAADGTVRDILVGSSEIANQLTSDLQVAFDAP